MSEQPRDYILDVMVPSHGHLELLITCLKALYSFTPKPFHLIVVDNSTDLTPLWLNQFCKEHDNVTYIHKDGEWKCGNQFFNRALEVCKTPFMATVMNSVRVEPDWAPAGLQIIQSDPKIGIVGFKCLLPNGVIESAGIKMNQWLPCDIARGEPGHRFSLVYEIDAVQWAFALVRVEAAKGHLPDDVFHGFVGWDDIDNCFVLKKNGWKVFYCGAGAGFHEPRATRGDDSKEAELKNRENGITFYKRWGFWEEFVRQHGADGPIHMPPKPKPNGNQPLPVEVA